MIQAQIVRELGFPTVVVNHIRKRLLDEETGEWTNCRDAIKTPKVAARRPFAHTKVVDL